MDFESKLHFLSRRDGAAMPHRCGTSLLAHLVGTHAILSAWGEAAEAQDAGLFHSVYGTSRYYRPLFRPDERAMLRDLIGDYAEALVFHETIGPKRKERRLIELRYVHRYLEEHDESLAD